MKNIIIIILGMLCATAFYSNAQYSEVGITQVTLISAEQINFDTTFIDTLIIGDGTEIINSLNYTEDSLAYQQHEIGLLDIQFENPNGATVHIDVFLEIGNGELESIYNGTSTETFITDDVYFSCSEYFISQLLITLRINSQESEPLSEILTTAIAFKGDPPIIVTTSARHKDPNKAGHCVPDVDLIKFYIHNKSILDFEIVSIFLDGTDVSNEILYGTGNGVMSIPDILHDNTYKFWLDINGMGLATGVEYEITCYFLHGNILNQGATYFTISCCEYESKIIDDPDSLNYFAGAFTSVTIDGNNNVNNGAIILEADEEAWVQVVEEVVILPGFETKDNAVFEAYIAPCNAVTFASRNTAPEKTTHLQNNKTTKWHLNKNTSKEKRENEPESKTAHEPLFDFLLFPNPFEDYVEIRFESKEKTAIEFFVFGITGQQFLHVEDNVFSENGVYRKRLDTTGIPKGSYIVKLYAGKQSYVQKMIKL